VGKAVPSQILPAVRDAAQAQGLDASTQALLDFSRRHLD